MVYMTKLLYKIKPVYTPVTYDLIWYIANTYTLLFQNVTVQMTFRV